MRIRVLRAATFGLCLGGLLGCSTLPPTQPAVETVPANVPIRAELKDMGAEFDAASAQEIQQRRGRRYRYRRIVIGGTRYFIPYYAYQNYYLPNYLRVDPQWYYVYAYTGPNFTGTRRLIRIRRDRDRDRDWNDRRDWNRDWSDRGDWRDRDRD